MQTVYEIERLSLKILDSTYADLVLDYFLRNEEFLEEWEPHKTEEFYIKVFQEQ